MKNAACLSAVLALVSSASAHLFISSPSPIPGSAPKDPLAGDGSNFPCHGATLPGSGGQSMAVGSSQALIFDAGNGANTAAHGGGSCQISITYETDAAKIKDPSNWKVLYSIEGGCPTNSPLNLNGNFPAPGGGSYTGAKQCSDPTSNGYDCLNSFNFTIPQGVKNGQGTLAWTWFNNVGNREMYMNCVAVDISGGASDASQMSSLPNMFVANLASVNGGTCATTEQHAVQFPNPGKYVLTKTASSRIPVSTAKDYPLAVPSGCGNVVNSPAAPSSAPAAGSKSSSTAGSKSSSTAAVATTAARTTLATTTANAPAGATPAVPKKNTSASKPAAASTGGAASPSVAPKQGACAAGSVACTGINSVSCIDETHYGICDYNNCAISMPVAPGTMCKAGAITWATPSKPKRHIAKHIHGQQHY